MKKINNVLCPIAFFEKDAAVLRMAHDFCQRNDAQLTVVHVLWSLFPPYFREMTTVGNVPTADEQRETVEAYMGHYLKNHLGDSDHIEAHVLLGDPAEAIVAFAEENEFDMVIMPVRDMDASGRFMMGSVSYKVLSASKVPVLTVADTVEAEELGGYKVLVAVDVHFGIAKMKETLTNYFTPDTEIELLIVVDPWESRAEKDHEKQVLEYETARVRGLGFEKVHGKVIKDRHAADAILERLKEGNFDLVMMNTHGRQGISQFVLGSTTAEVIHHAEVPVLSIKSERALETEGGYYTRIPLGVR